MPVAESRSSYNGLLVLLFITFSGFFAAFVIHALASNKVRRGPAWDCGFPDASPATQYTASSFAQPIRRVFGTVVFRARDTVEMPPPGSMRPARFDADIHDLIWDTLYAPAIGSVAHAAEKLNRLQFLTIRRYLSLVFLALVLLAPGARAMAMIHDFAVQAAQMVLVLALAPLLTGFVRKVKARLMRRRGPPLLQPYRELLRLLRQGSRARRERVVALPRRALYRVCD